LRKHFSAIRSDHVLLLLVGLAIIAVPILISARTLARLTRELGAVDASEVAVALERSTALRFDALRARLSAEAPRSIAARLVCSMDDEATSPRQAELALAETVAEIERELGQDARAPRVAASIATSGGLLAATWVMREGLGRAVPEGVDVLTFFTAVIERGLTLAAMAVLGGIVCASLHRNAQRQRRARMSELDALIAPLHARLGRALQLHDASNAGCSPSS
jgi:hypothetical protein